MKKYALVVAMIASLLIAPYALAAPAKSFSGSGTYRIGTDIAPGIYISDNKVTQSCYWERLSDFTGSFDSIIANDFAKGQMIVQVLKTDTGFKASGCAKFYQIGSLKTLKTIPQEGVFQVGKQVLPGTYQSKSTSGKCYWARLSSFRGDFESIIDNDYSAGKQIVQIVKGDKGFESSGCGGWVKIG